ncbi:MAG: cell wall hydrolase, partial [Ruminococcus sp.]|nr:cell wall hydrolase [Ruminococcus sp.]
VSTCLFGGLLGVYVTAPVVSSAAPESDSQSIYNVQSKELTNTAVFTSIGTTITKTSIEFTTANAVTTASAETTAPAVPYDTYSTIAVTSSSPITATTAETTVPVYTDKAITADAMFNTIEEETEEEVSENIVDFGISAGNLSDCFIASDEISEETAENYSWETSADDYNESDTSEYIDSANEYLEEEYYAPAFEYIVTSPVTSYEETYNTNYSTTVAETYCTDFSYDDCYNEYYDYYSDYYDDYYYSDYFHNDSYAETTPTEEAAIIATETTATEAVSETATETTTTAIDTTAEESVYETTSEATSTETIIMAETYTATEIQTTAPETTSTVTATTEVTTVTTPETYLPITDSEYILLCNAVANEAGSSWIGLYEKGNVVEVIMNRVNSPLYPNTIIEVITQVNQFTGSENYAYLGTYSQYVTDEVKEAVNLYFNEPSSFSHNYFGFYGDGFQNYFY